ncbi:MAG: hypothetical protein QM780_08465 [Hyphomicrobium sp.]|uniref:hypothetical protein n=1 Tax=Hyphomicrobium sp. TaxID=82 RepID=UPI0039E42D03
MRDFSGENFSRQLSFALAMALLGSATILAVVRPLIEADAWEYHLPFSARLWDLGGGKASFHLNAKTEARWDGFPLAWEWVQGLFWAATSSLRATIVPQLVLCFAYFAYVRHVLNFPIFWNILGFFACPMLFIHFESTYFDLPAGLCLAIGFFALFAVLRDLRLGIFSRMHASVALASLGLAGNIKFQSLLSCYLIIGIAALFYLFNNGLNRGYRGYFLGLLAACTVLASTSVASNFVRHQNPFYPAQIQLGNAVVFSGPENVKAESPSPTYQIFHKVVTLPGPINFFLSITEFDWALRGVVPSYTIDSWGGDIPQRGGPGRTGGWGSLFATLNFFIIVLQIFMTSKKEDERQHQLALACLLLIVGTSFFPIAHELRYWLCIPLIMVPVNLKFLYERLNGPITLSALGAMTAYGVMQVLSSPFSHVVLGTGNFSQEAPAPLIAALQKTGRYCAPYGDYIFRFSEAVTGRPGLLSNDPKDCEQLPQGNRMKFTQ